MAARVTTAFTGAPSGGSVTVTMGAEGPLLATLTVTTGEVRGRRARGEREAGLAGGDRVGAWSEAPEAVGGRRVGRRRGGGGAAQRQQRSHAAGDGRYRAGDGVGHTVKLNFPVESGVTVAEAAPPSLTVVWPATAAGVTVPETV